jgi:hypothetical protein
MNEPILPTLIVGGVAVLGLVALVAFLWWKLGRKR